MGSSIQGKPLGVILDDQLNFKRHMSNLCKKASPKLNALALISSFMDFPKRRVIMKAYTNSQFGHCPLIWTMHSQSINNKINSVYEQALRIAYKDIRIIFSLLRIFFEFKTWQLKSMLDICKFY